MLAHAVMLAAMDHHSLTHGARAHLEREAEASVQLSRSAPGAPAEASVIAFGFYVVDNYTPDFIGAIMSGPHADYGAANEDRRRMNIADDCSVVEVVA